MVRKLFNPSLRVPLTEALGLFRIDFPSERGKRVSFYDRRESGICQGAAGDDVSVSVKAYPFVPQMTGCQ